MCKIKYNCPYYVSRGGHCSKQSYEIEGYLIHRGGCDHPNDISKCKFVMSNEDFIKKYG